LQQRISQARAAHYFGMQSAVFSANSLIPYVDFLSRFAECREEGMQSCLLVPLTSSFVIYIYYF
jgi:hypothetical protein